MKSTEYLYLHFSSLCHTTVHRSIRVYPCSVILGVGCIVIAMYVIQNQYIHIHIYISFYQYTYSALYFLFKSIVNATWFNETNYKIVLRLVIKVSTYCRIQMHIWTIVSLNSHVHEYLLYIKVYFVLPLLVCICSHGL